MSLINNTYFKSSDVKVYPAAFRGAYTINGGTYEGQQYIFDPESRMPTEFNTIHAGNALDRTKSYIVKWDTAAKTLICVIGGYYFELYNVSLSDFVTSAKKVKALTIKLREIELKDNTDSNYGESTIDSRRTTWVLANQYDEGSYDALDLEITENVWAFTGLTATTSITAADAYLIPVTINALGTPTINYSAFLPKVESGLGTDGNATGTGIIVNSVQLGENSIALGRASLATGMGTNAVGLASMTSGKDTIAYGEASFAEGAGKALARTVTSKNSSSILLNDISDLQVGSILSYSDGYTTYYLKVTGFTNNGRVQLNDTSKLSENDTVYLVKGIAYGKTAHSEGTETVASGDYSQASGYNTFASGEASQASGNNTVASGKGSSAEGNSAIASGNYAHAEGSYVDDESPDTPAVLGANGAASHTEGYNASVGSKAIAGHAEGARTAVFAKQGHAEGYHTRVNKPDENDDDSGVGAHAEGFSTTTNNKAAHAEGELTTASGEASHAEGNNTIATGNYSHTEGNNTKAYSNGAHAEGNNSEAGDPESTASSMWAHAEGESTKASGAKSHAEGYSTQATSTAAHAEGHFTKATAQGAHAEGGFDYTPGGQLYTEATGKYSHAEGEHTKATNIGTHSEGRHTEATNDSSHAEGKYTRAIGNWSHAEGYGGDADTYTNYGAVGYGCHVEGFETIAGDIENPNNTQGNYYAHAEGENTIAKASGSHAEGYCAQALGNYAHAEGYDTRAGSGSSCTAAHAEGYKTIAVNSGTHAEGQETKADSTNSHAEGYKTLATAVNAHAEGEGNGEDKGIASGTDSHSEGRMTIACGYGAHAEGNETIAGDPEAVNSTNASYYSHAEGSGTIAKGAYSHTEGLGTKASSDCQHVFGKYNIEDTNSTYVEIVGNGSAAGTTTTPGNARTLDWYGNEWLAGGLVTENGGGTFNGTVTANALDIGSDESTIDGNTTIAGILTVNNTAEIKDTLTVVSITGTGNWHTDGNMEANTYNATSDARLKENITPYVSEKSILDLPIYKYDFIDGAKNQIGCLAQDLQIICPEIVHENENGFLSIQEGKLIYLLLEEVKKLKEEVKKLKGE